MNGTVENNGYSSWKNCVNKNNTHMCMRAHTCDTCMPRLYVHIYRYDSLGIIRILDEWDKILNNYYITL